jgi:hypothetical protein
MNVEAIRHFMDEHPDGIVVRMVDGSEFKIPHRDYVSFGPPRDTPAANRGRYATAFIVYDIDDDLRMRMVNALLVKDLQAWERGKNGSSRSGGRKKSK